MNEQASLVVVDIAKEFIEFIRQAEPRFTKAFYRFRSEGSRYGSNGSYVVDANVMLISTMKNSHFYEYMNAKNAKLLEIMGRHQGVFLLTIDAEFNYDIKFEWENLHRWEITKANGGTGIPLGI